MITRFERFTRAVNEINRCWHNIAAQEMANYGLKAVHASYLITLLHHPDGITAAEVGRSCGRDKAEVSRMMNMLQQKGLVSRAATGSGVYRAAFTLTSQGQTAAKQVSFLAQTAVEFAGGQMSEQERALFYNCLDQIVDNLRILDEKGIPKPLNQEIV